MPQYILQMLSSWEGTRAIDTTDPVIIRKYTSTTKVILKEYIDPKTSHFSNLIDHMVGYKTSNPDVTVYCNKRQRL